jgi:hypothetical protein
MNGKLVFLVLVLIALSFFSVRYVGYVIQDSFSDVGPEDDERVNPGLGGRDITKQADISAEVQEPKSMFDIMVDLKRNQYIPGEDIIFTLYLTNNGDLENIDVLVYYSIIDFEGKVLTFKQESIAIDNSLSMIRQLHIPDNAVFGDYVLYASIDYKEAHTTTSKLFIIGEIELAPIFGAGDIVWIIMIIIILASFVIIFIFWRRERKARI